MFLRNLISGARTFRAPEDDNGFEHEDRHEGQNQDDEGALDEEVDPDEIEDEEPADHGEEDDASGDARQTPRRADDVGQRRQSRGENRVQRALNEAKTAREELAAFREEVRRGQQQPQEQRETPAARAARLATLSTDEYVAEMIRETEEKFTRALGSVQLQTADTADKGAFATLCARNAVVAGMADEVERKLAEARRNGANTSREAIATFLLGQRTLAKAGKVAPKQRADAAASRDQQRARPGGARSDLRPAARGGDDRAARKARLADMEI